MSNFNVVCEGGRRLSELNIHSDQVKVDINILENKLHDSRINLTGREINDYHRKVYLFETINKAKYNIRLAMSKAL